MHRGAADKTNRAEYAEKLSKQGIVSATEGLEDGQRECSVNLRAQLTRLLHIWQLMYSPRTRQRHQ